MPDATTLVYKALNSDQQLINLLENKKQVGNKTWNRIYNSPVAPHADEYPRVTMFEVINEDAVPADNKFLCSDVNIRIDVWLKSIEKLSIICKQIKQVLINNFENCNIQLDSTMHEKDTEVYHKPINIYLLIEQE